MYCISPVGDRKFGGDQTPDCTHHNRSSKQTFHHVQIFWANFWWFWGHMRPWMLQPWNLQFQGSLEYFHVNKIKENRSFGKYSQLQYNGIKCQIVLSCLIKVFDWRSVIVQKSLCLYRDSYYILIALCFQLKYNSIQLLLSLILTVEVQ